MLAFESFHGFLVSVSEPLLPSSLRGGNWSFFVGLVRGNALIQNSLTNTNKLVYIIRNAFLAPSRRTLGPSVL